MLVIEIVPPAVALSSIALTGRGHNLWMDRKNDEDALFISQTRTNPSLPGMHLVILPNAQRDGGKLSFLIRTRSPTLKFGWANRHLERFCRVFI